jgi:hypothetical protein
MRPALIEEKDAVVAQWVSGKRTKETEGITDEGLKQRAAAIAWVLGWEDIAKTAAERLQQQKAMEDATEPLTDGRGPYG